MSPSRREFLWTMGAAAATVALKGAQDVIWTSDEVVDPGWAPGIEELRNSACLICPSRCGIRGRLVDGRLVRISGNPLHPLSRGGLCPRGVAGVQMLYHPDRLAGPLVRSGPRGSGSWESVTPERALEHIAERLGGLRATGRPEGLALLAGYNAGTMQELWRQFLHSFGSPNYVADEYEDGTDAVVGLMHGIKRRPAYDLDHARLVVSFGAPMFESWWSPLQAFVAFANPESDTERGPRFVQVDTRFSRTASRAHEWVGVRPGTHAVLALGIAYVLIRDELFDADFVARHVSGFEDFVDAQGQRREGYRSLVMRNYRTEEVSAITGVPVARITALARAIAANRPAVALCGTDVTFASNGLLAGLAVHSINVLTGSINRPGGVVFPEDTPIGPLATPVLDETARPGGGGEPIGAGGSPFASGDPALRFAAAVAGEAASVEALLLYYANPIASSTQPQVWREALEKIPFVVSFSPFLDETARYADVVLPDLLPYERWQDAPAPSSYPYPVWGLAQPLVEAHEGATHTGDAVLALARNLGGSVAESLPYEDFAALLKERARGLFAVRHGMTLGGEFERMHQRQMEERGWWLPVHTDFEAFWDDLVERGGWTDLFYDHTDPYRLAQTDSGRIELMPAALLSALAEEGSELRPYLDVATQTAVDSTEFGLRLIPYRVSTLASGTLYLERWLAEQPGIFPDVLWHPWVEVAPETAHALGLSDDTLVWVVSPQGRYRARLKVFPGTAPETVCAPYGLRQPEGEPANPLRLLDSTNDPLTGLPSWSSTFVRLERA
ncbi:MAG: molybdopterin-dependent oxidoreductase [Gemmatimonadetes bacterium]|nr:molybdopterin-dependent oxidoreductase [Gemmatimonadota bacterium]NIO31331.1 molybdopterin-dependent oxidoreductase [Gemmatimonadota bacterium]